MHDVIVALECNARMRPDAEAFSAGPDALTWRQCARRVAGAAEALDAMPQMIGLLADDGLDWVVADLAVAATGRIFVPLPTMFSDGQLAHIVSAAQIGCLIADTANMPRARRLCPTIAPVPTSFGDCIPDGAKAARRVIFTSGSTGEPKGVVHGDRQLGAMAHALAAATSADAGDHYMSVLPLSLLLEEVCAIHVPVLVGGRCDIVPGVSAALAAGDTGALADAAERCRPSVTVLVPELLRAWVGALRQTGHRAPDSLRFVAVGGAPVPAPVADLAWSLGLPVYEGYGLSECGSVVALNRIDARTGSTVGRPLDGVAVAIEDDEIVVRGATVMEGYLDGSSAYGVWRTGDLGHFDALGNLVVAGRRDNLLVTANGRNIQAEWVETILTGDPRILRAVVIGHGASTLTAVVTPVPAAAQAFAAPGAALQIVRTACADLPAYAIPGRVFVAGDADLAAGGLLTATGRPRRRAIAIHYARPATDPALFKEMTVS
jgi:long-subunit acyl-CoA synthetase (AMP-forming)